LYTVSMFKRLVWVGTTLDDLRTLPDEARRIAGHALHLVQLGQEPSDWKPMSTLGAGVHELRVRTAVEHRVFYVAKFAEGIYVLHVFQKKTQKTASRDIELGRRRYRSVLSRRKALGHPEER